MRPFLAPPPTRGIEPVEVPTVSVVIRAYRADDTIQDAVRSALEQTVPPHEVIVVDDGSPEDIRRTLHAYLERITLVRKAHGGGASAMNAGAEAATGDFVAVLDADDCYLAEQIEALGELAAARPDLDLVMTDSFIEVDGQVVGRRYSDSTPFAPDRQRLAILARNFIAWPAIRRRRFFEVGRFDESLQITHDWDFYVRLIYAGARAGLVNLPLHRYRIKTGSLSDDPVKARIGELRVLERATQLPLAHPERATLAETLRQKRMEVALVKAEMALRNRVPDARRLALAVALGPDFVMRARVKALGAVVAPGPAARLLDARERRSGWSRLQRLYPRQ